jgi:hypothetical protein
MANTKTSVALVPSPDARAVEIDRSVVGAPAANLTNVVGELMGALKSSLSDKDDVTVEVAAHTDATRSSAHVKIRGYRHRTRDDAAT